MDSVSILSFKKMPEIRAKVYISEIVNLKEKVAFKGDTHSRLFIVLSGSTTYILKSEAVEKGFSSNHILTLPAGEEIIFTSATNTCQLLHISFDLFATHNLEDFLNQDDNPTFQYCKLQLLKDFSSISSLEENYPYIQSQVHNLITHCKLNSVDLKIVGLPLENLLYTMLRVQFSTTINVLRAVKAISITPNKFQFHKPFCCDVSEYKFLTHPLSANSKSEEICTIVPNQIFVERPTEKNYYSYFNMPDPANDNKICLHFNQTDGDRFKFWFFPGFVIPPLEDYKNTAVISFKFKANQTGSFLLMLYHTPSYQCITYAFEVKEVDCWTEFEIPISKNSSLHAMIPYIEKAVQFIHDNYAEKITIQDIADQVRIHPSYLSYIFRKSLNQSVNSYINFHRINMAKNLLKNTNTSITDIALQTGFYDAQHFLKTFKKSTGFTPSKYRNIE